MKRKLLAFATSLLLLSNLQAQNLWEIISGSSDHETLTELMELVGFDAIFDTADEIDATIWAPNDAAFAALPPELVTALVEDPDALAQVLLYHVSLPTVFSGGLANGQTYPSLLGGLPLTITITSGNIFVNESQVVAPFNLDGENGGIVHSINAVMLPPDVCLEFATISTTALPNAPVNQNGLCSTVSLPFQVWAGELYQSAGYVAGVTYVASICEGPNAGAWEAQLALLDTDLNVIAFADGCELTFEVPEDGTYVIGISDLNDCGGETNAEVNNGVLSVTCIGEAGASTIWNVVQESEVHMTLEAAIEAAGLDAVLDGPGSFTLFAPTDAAFTALGTAVDDLLLDPTGALANVLLYHVVGAVALSTDLSDGQEITTLQGENVTVTISGGNVFVNGAQVTTADIETANGVVHVIDAVLLPEWCTVFTAQINNFVDVGGAPAPDANGECPVIAFTNFGVYPGEGYPVNNMVAGTEYTFSICDGVGAGVWEASIAIVNLATGALIAVDNGCEITWTAETNEDIVIVIHEQGTCGNQSTFQEVDGGSPSLTCTGVEPTTTVVDIIVGSPVHTTLASLVVAAGLVDVLSGDGPFTVFAPTDEAFDAVDPATLAALAADPFGLLTQVLTYHVAPLEALSPSLSNGQIVPTVNGENLTIGVTTEVTVGNSLVTATVTTPDLIADNGVVHVINAVLIPTTLNTANVEGLESLLVFPNPTANQFTVDINLSHNHSVTIDLVNILGQNVRSFDLGHRSHGLNRQYVDVSGLANGFYLMNITVGDSQIVTKVQVQK